MNFKTFRLEEKKSQVIVRSKVKYDMFTIFPKLDFIKVNNVFTVDEGKKFFDLIGDQGPLRFMSERVKNLIEKNSITGLDFFSIKIEGVDLPYYGYVKKETFNSHCEYDEDGDFVHGTLRVDMSSWDGVTDIFSIKDSGATVCTSRVQEIFETAKITNIEFKNLSDY